MDPLLAAIVRIAETVGAAALTVLVLLWVIQEARKDRREERERMAEALVLERERSDKKDAAFIGALDKHLSVEEANAQQHRTTLEQHRITLGEIVGALRLSAELDAMRAAQIAKQLDALEQKTK